MVIKTCRLVVVSMDVGIIYFWLALSASVINITHSVDSLGVSCDFEEDTCGWNQSVTTSSRNNANWERFLGASTNTLSGPLSGHGAEDSWYMYVDGSDSNYDDQAIIMSPYVINYTGRRECYFFSFWYHMVGDNVGSLSVLLYSQNNRMTEALWHQSTPKGDGWIQGGVQFTETGNFRLYLVTKRGSGRQSDVAVDDLRLAKSYCGTGLLPSVINDYFECDNGHLISSELVCDGEDQCGDGSDESANILLCAEAVGMSYRLSFDMATIIGITVCMALIVIIIAAVSIICYRRNKRGQTHIHHTTQDTTRSEQPPDYTPSCPHYNMTNHYHNPDHTDCNVSKCNHNDQHDHTPASCLLTPPPYNSIILTNEHCDVDPVKLPNNDETTNEQTCFIRCDTCQHNAANTNTTPSSGDTDCSDANKTVANIVQCDTSEPTVSPPLNAECDFHVVNVPSSCEDDSSILPVPVVPSAPPNEDTVGI